MNKKDLNRDLIIDRISEIKLKLKQIMKTKEISLESYLKDDMLKDATKFRLLSLIEGMISLCNHIVSRSEISPQSTYSECFSRLSELGIISENLVDKIVNMIRFRNILVHQYWIIDEEKIYEIAQIDHAFVEEFLERINQFLEES